MKRALVLSGGGSRGSYEIGAWQAIKECGLRFDMVYGTSIGALNAALIVQGNEATAVSLWDNITLSQLMGDAADDFNVDKMISSKRDIIPFLLENGKNLRMDVAPLRKLITNSISEGLVRAAGIQLNVTTVRMPSATPVQISLADMKQGQLTDWLMASSACFPIFPMQVIDSLHYMDGGFYDNLPIDKAIRDGAEELICVDLHPSFTHPEYLNLPQMTVIKPHSSLGGFLDFNPKIIRRRRRQGYLDAMKALGRYDGCRYSFKWTSPAKIMPTARRYAELIALLDAKTISRMAFIKGNSGISAPLLGALSSDSALVHPNHKTAMLRGLEIAMRHMDFREDCLYDYEAVTALIIGTFDKGELPNVPFSARSLKENAENGSRTLLEYIYRGLNAPEKLTQEQLRMLTPYADTFAAALYLHCML